jgi:hypothetical protein
MVREILGGASRATVVLANPDLVDPRALGADSEFAEFGPQP